MFHLLMKVFFFFQAKYIAQCMDEIKAELRQENFAVKANAVAKLTYVSRFLLIFIMLLIIKIALFMYLGNIYFIHFLYI